MASPMKLRCSAFGFLTCYLLLTTAHCSENAKHEISDKLSNNSSSKIDIELNNITILQNKTTTDNKTTTSQNDGDVLCIETKDKNISDSVKNDNLTIDINLKSVDITTTESAFLDDRTKATTENQSIANTTVKHNIKVINVNSTDEISDMIPDEENASLLVIKTCDTGINESKINNVTEAPIETTVSTEASNDENVGKTEEYIDVTANYKEFRETKEAIIYGLKKMRERYQNAEPRLFSMGYVLEDDNPARFVAAFNAPTEDAEKMAQYGYAALEATAKFQAILSEGTAGVEGREEEHPFPNRAALRQSALHDQCPLRGSPRCPPASKRYRTHDGTCNNALHPRWGSSMTPVQRFLPPEYADGLQAPRAATRGPQLPSAREVSSSIHEERRADSTTAKVTHLLMQWGQFVDHDITSSSQARGFNGSVPRCCRDGGRDVEDKDFLHPECFPILVPANDPFYRKFGIRCLEFLRSSPASRQDCELGWREQINQVTAFLDGSPLYGSSVKQSDKLRLFRNGMLQYGRVQSRKPLLPPERDDKDELCRRGAVSTDCFKSGDNRVNEHPGLVAMHIVWLRMHNRMSTEISNLNSHWSDEKIYQETRKIVGAMIQQITYSEFLPVVLGSEVMKLFDLRPMRKGYYKGYNRKVNVSPGNAFGAAAFRFGHSLVQPSFMRFNRFHEPIPGNVTLHEEVSNPDNLWSFSAVDRLLTGMIDQPSQKRDEFITDELTNHLFQTPRFRFGMDLAAINIQRGRDHGLPPYATWREPCGLTPIDDWSDLYKIMSPRTVNRLQDIYRNVNDIDLFTGGMCERPVIGGLVGPTFACIIAQQFSNNRKGDRFWYENGNSESSFTPAQLQQIRRVTLAQVLCRALDSIITIQPFVFLSADDFSNERVPCDSDFIDNFDLSPWTERHADFTDNDIPNFDKHDKDGHENLQTKTTMNTRLPQLTTTAATVTLDSKLNFDIPEHKDDQTTTNTEQLTIDGKLDFLRQASTRKLDTDDDSNIYNIEIPYAKSPIKKPRTDDNFTDELHLNTGTDNITDNAKAYQIKLDRRYYTGQINNDDDRNRYQNIQPIKVTENMKRFTYLVNIVPRTTPKYHHNERDPVKITYQSSIPHTYQYPTHNNRPVYENNDYVQRPITYVTVQNADDGNYNQYKENLTPLQTYLQKLAALRPTHRPKVKNQNRHASDIVDVTESAQRFVTFTQVDETLKRDKTVTVDKTVSDRRDDGKTGTDVTFHRGVIRNNVPILDDTKYNRLNENKTIQKDTVENTRHKQTSHRLNFYSEDRRNESTTDRNKTTYGIENDSNNKDRNKTIHRLYNITTAKPTNRHVNGDNKDKTETATRYFYIGNILHKYPQPNAFPKVTNKITQKEKLTDVLDENYNTPWKSKDSAQREEFQDLDVSSQVNLETRNRPVGIDAEPAENKEGNVERLILSSKAPNSKRKPQINKGSVMFEVIPSENSPNMWEFYKERDEQNAVQKKMPQIASDPQALKELPRPMNFSIIANYRRKNRPPAKI